MFCHPNSSIARSPALHRISIACFLAVKKNENSVTSTIEPKRSYSNPYIKSTEQEEDKILELGPQKVYTLHISYTAQQVWTTRVSTQIH